MKKVLIIDDDKTFQATMATKLKDSGYQSVCALDGKEGLDMAEAEKPDVILLDLKMPKLDGLGFLELLQLKKAEGEKKTPVFITSNLSGIDEISEGVALGVKGYIVKSDETLDTIVSAINDMFAAQAEAEKA